MILAVTVVAGFVLAAAAVPLDRLLGRNAGFALAAAFAAATAALASVGPGVLAGSPLAYEATWIPTLGISFALVLDSVALLFSLIVVGIGAIVMAYSGRYFEASGSHGRTYGLMTFFAASMLGLVLADDVVLLFVFWELTSVASYFLIGGKGEGAAGATRAFLTTSLGGLALLAGALLLAADAETFRLSEMLARGGAPGSPLAAGAMGLILLAAFTKSAQFPFHFWLPGAMVAPTPVSTYLHAATMVKAGIYLLFRMTPMYGDAAAWQLTLVLVGLATAILGAVIAVARTDLKALLAYSTVSQLGLIVAIVGVGSPRALAAAALHTLAHALFKSTLFLTVGVVEHETGSRDLRILRGLRRRLPAVALAGGLGALSMAGLPPLVGFVSKEEALAAFLEAPGPTWLGPTAAALAVAASMFTFAYSARFYWGTFEGDGAFRNAALHRPAAWFVAPALVTAIGGLAVGLRVPLLDPLVEGVAVNTTGRPAGAGLALWHGFGLPLLLSGLVIAGGIAAFVGRVRLERARVRPARVGRVFPFDGARAFDYIYDGTLRVGHLVGGPSRSNAPGWYLAPLLAVIVGLGAGASAGVDLDMAGAPAPSLVADWVVVALLAMSVAGVVQARSRLGAVATLGLSGFLVAGWFVLLGAPDLALTQLLVETLTIALVVVVFRRLPRAFVVEPGGRRLAAASIAIAVGAMAGGATYAFTGRRSLSDAGRWYLADAERVTGGANVVNTILVDFRALDTLGEITVLGAAALGIFALARLAAPRAVSRSVDDIAAPARAHDLPAGAAGSPPGRSMIDSAILRTANRLLAPLMVGFSLYLLVRGHDAVGGGFIGGLTGGAAAVLLYLSEGHARIWESRLLRIVPLVGGGLLVAVGYGLGGLAATGAFLAGGTVLLPARIEVAASLVFDVGVYLVVVGMVVSIVRHLGRDLPEELPVPHERVAR